MEDDHQWGDPGIRRDVENEIVSWRLNIIVMKPLHDGAAASLLLRSIGILALVNLEAQDISY